jgi:hypothetical protein
MVRGSKVHADDRQHMSADKPVDDVNTNQLIDPPRGGGGDAVS